MSAILTDKLYENLPPVVTKLERDKDGNVQVEKVDVSTRARHRQYMKDHGLALAEDFKGEWAKAERERADLAQGTQSEAEVREALARAAYKVFDSPGVQQRPRRPDVDDDAPVGGAYPVVTHYLPAGTSRLVVPTAPVVPSAPRLVQLVQEGSMPDVIKSRTTTAQYRAGFEATFEWRDTEPVEEREVSPHDCERCGKHMQYDDQSCACSARDAWLR